VARVGEELFFRSGSKLMSVAIQSGPEFSASRPRMLFEGRFGGAYDVSPDGSRFVFPAPQAGGPTEIHVVLHWFGEVHKDSLLRTSGLVRSPTIEIPDALTA
jgi:hypothetical protein